MKLKDNIMRNSKSEKSRRKSSISVNEKKCIDVDLLKTSWTFQAKNFFKNSSLHGVKFIAKTESPFHEKFMWFSIVLVGILLTIFVMILLWEKFQSTSTITSIDTQFSNFRIPFPAITICPLNRTRGEKIRKFVTRRWNITKEDRKYNYYENFLSMIADLSYENLYELSSYENDTTLDNFDFKTLPLEVSLSCDDLLSDCVFKGVKVDCCQIFNRMITDLGICYVFNSKYNNYGKENGNSIENVEPLFIYETDTDLSLQFEAVNVSENPLNVYIHDYEERPTTDLSPPFHVLNGNTDRILFEEKTTYTTENARELSINQRQCVFFDEISLSVDRVYTYSACMTQCRIDEARKRCQCLPAFYSFINDYKSCNIKGLLCVAREKHIALGSRCNCELSCKHTVYQIAELRIVSSEFKNRFEIAFISRPFARYKRDVLFGWVDLLVGVGGIAGLFLGFSLLSGVETVYYFTLRACCMLHRDKRTLRKLKRQYEMDLRKNPDIDIIRKMRSHSKMRKQRTTNKVYPFIS